MKRVLKWAGIGLGTIVGLLVVALAGLYGWSGYLMSRSLAVDPPMEAVAAETPDLEYGAHIAAIRGCTDCHGENLGGRVVIDDPMAGRLVAPNLTKGTGSGTGEFTDADWVRAIRHGLDPTGRKLVFMPSYEYAGLAATDMADLVAYLKSIPPVDSNLPGLKVGPIMRVMHVTGQYPLLSADIIDHDAPFPAKPDPADAVEMGGYLATGCTGCHGPGFSGGKIPGTPPEFPTAANLTMDATGLADWSRDQFRELLRTGIRPDGRQLDHQFMPWKTTREMTDQEIDAVWAYLNSVPPKSHGNR